MLNLDWRKYTEKQPKLAQQKIAKFCLEDIQRKLIKVSPEENNYIISQEEIQRKIATIGLEENS